MQTLITPLLAAGIDLGHLAGILVVLFLAVMKHLFEANKPKHGPAVPPQPKPQPAPRPQPAPAGGQQADELRRQVEEFLRRAGKPPQPAAKPAPDMPPRPTREIELLVEDPANERRSLGAPLPSKAQRSGSAAAGDKRRAARRGDHRQSVAEHVAEHVAASTQSIAQKSSRLGQRIVTDDLEFDQQLKAKFDHSIGTLAGATTEAPATDQQPPALTPAAQIAALLANPDGVRQAVLLNEILRPPSERW